MIGGNVIDDNFKKVTVEKQIDNICQILGAKARHYIVVDKKTSHRKIVIEYDHSSNLQQR